MKSKTQKGEEKSIGTRYPVKLLEQMKQLAQQHHRSFNAEVVWALQQYVEREEVQEHVSDQTRSHRQNEATR